ncbi:MAG: hypothetical protein C0404_02605 [Verrucomicrobia bacterium]|nr:hypothetical protein [Verrucomicrobiota bacterium]
MRDWGLFLCKYLYAAAASLYLFTVGVFSGRNRPLISRICSHFGFPRRYAIPEVKLADVAPEDKEIEIHEAVGINGNISLLETVVLAKLLRKHNPRTVFEFGTFNGRTTLNMAANTGTDAKIYTLDLPEEGAGATTLPAAPAEKALATGRITGEKFRGTRYERKITQLYGDSAAFAFAPFNGRMDFVFVDGSHSYAYVLSDTIHAVELLKGRRGVIVWHDYGTEGWDGVVRCLNKLHADAGVFAGMRRVEGTTLVVLVLG